MTDEPEIKSEVLSTHELIQAAHKKNITDHFDEVERKTYKELTPQKIEDIAAIKLMLQALMDKLKGLDAFVRRNIPGYNGKIYESSQSARPTANTTNNHETNIREGEKPLLR